MARMWMVRGEGGSLYDAFRERGVAAVGWNQLAADAKPGVGRKQLIALYQSAVPRAKQGTVVSGASQVWRFVNDIQDGDWLITYSPANRLYSIGKVTAPAEYHPEWAEQGMPLAHKVQWQAQELPRDNLGTEQSLQVCCSAFHGISAATAAARWPNLTLKKIPKMVLARCEWGHDDYSLNVANLPLAKPSAPAPAAKATKSGRKPSDSRTTDLFGDGGEA